MEAITRNPGSTDGWHYSPNPADRSAFLFNLTADLLERQRADAPGLYQTYNVAGAGPDFGDGNDLVAVGSLDAGYASAYSYGTDSGFAGSIIPPSTPGFTFLQYSGLEVFTIGPVPEPGTWAILGFGVVGLIARRKKKR